MIVDCIKTFHSLLEAPFIRREASIIQTDLKEKLPGDVSKITSVEGENLTFHFGAHVLVLYWSHVEYRGKMHYALNYVLYSKNDDGSYDYSENVVDVWYVIPNYVDEYYILNPRDSEGNFDVTTVETNQEISDILTAITVLMGKL